MSPTSPDMPGGFDAADATSGTAAALSIEEFAASIAASLTAELPATREADDGAHARDRRTSFRERVRQRKGSADLLVFRVAGELFAVELVASEEAMDMPVLHQLPEMPPGMLGVFTLRGALVSVFTPQSMLGIAQREATTIVVFSGSGRRVALAVDDVDDVLTVDLATVHDAPGTDASESVLVGVAHRGVQLIGILDADVLLMSFRAAVAVVHDHPKESA
ncbi:MAG TPA: chemotaxis protein CheW [Gemmatimonadaceae bacterium]|nr:chemotaxis protein CheW [Gemmatimonadaceae bacterium]